MKPCDLQKYFTGIIGDAWIDLIKRAPRHHLDKGIVIGIGHRDRADNRAIPKNCDPFGDPRKFLNTVRDIDNTDATRFQLGHEIKQMVDLPICERCRRLIQNQHLEVAVKGFGDLNHLLLRPRQTCNDGRRVYVKSQLFKHFSRSRPHGAVVQKRAAP